MASKTLLLILGLALMAVAYAMPLADKDIAVEDIENVFQAVEKRMGGNGGRP